jgi:hypothetical protein
MNFATLEKKKCRVDVNFRFGWLCCLIPIFLRWILRHSSKGIVLPYLDKFSNPVSCHTPSSNSLLFCALISKSCRHQCATEKIWKKDPGYDVLAFFFGEAVRTKLRNIHTSTQDWYGAQAWVWFSCHCLYWVSSLLILCLRC